MTVETNIVMPALGMAQETGKLLEWLKAEGQAVSKGEPLMQVETDKATVEVEAPASGILTNVTVAPGAEVRVGTVIAQIVSFAEGSGTMYPAVTQALPGGSGNAPRTGTEPAAGSSVKATPVAARFASEQGIDLSQITPRGERIEKADILAYLEKQTPALRVLSNGAGGVENGKLPPASPKARRLAGERGIDVAALRGSGPNGAVLAQDVPLYAPPPAVTANAAEDTETPTTLWRVMAERLSAAWQTIPHFYVVREVAASGLVEMRERVAPAVERRKGVALTYTDLLVKLVAAGLEQHLRLNASWNDGKIRTSRHINIGLATAIEDGLVVPVIHDANELSVGDIAHRRHELVARAHARKLTPADLADGTFTISNLGMYNVDAFNAIVNPPQAAILAVGRIAERVVAVDGQPAVRSMLTLTLSCDHRVVDGARAARFLDQVANWIQEPWELFI